MGDKAWEMMMMSHGWKSEPRELHYPSELRLHKNWCRRDKDSWMQLTKCKIFANPIHYSYYFSSIEIEIVPINSNLVDFNLS